MLDRRERAARARHPRFLLVVACVFVCLGLAVSGAWAAGATIGLYRDDTGSSCGFSNPTGIVTAYVVVKPATGGTRGVRFAVPVPSCFDGTFLAESTPPFVVAVGSSPTGISLSHRDCQTAPFTALTIFYMSNGGTTPCCEFPILADPATSLIEAVDCAFEPQAIFATSAYFNATASCPCGLGGQPVPINPTPPDASTSRPLNQTLAWDVSFNANVTYDVYFGTSVSPPLVASNQAAKTYNPGALTPFTTYRWMIVAKSAGSQFPGPVWSFSTGSGGAFTPSNPFPSDHALNISPSTALSWSVSPPQSQPMAYDVYFGDFSPPPLVAPNLVSPSFNPGQLLAMTNYYWRIVARDFGGNVNSGPVWTFTTAASSSNPLVPSNPDPPDGGVASSSPTLSWTSSGTQFGILISLLPNMSQIVQFGSSNIPRYSPGLLGAGRYYWQVYVNQSILGPVWSFTTTGGSLPVAFTHFDAKPSGNAVDVRWELASDEAMSGFTLYRRDGASSDAHIIAEGAIVATAGSYLDASVEAGKTYRYELLIRTPDGGEFRSQPATVTLPALALALHQNVPNPFNPQTTIRYELPTDTHVRLTVFDTSGRRIRTIVNEEQAAGSREVTWNGRDDAGNAVSSGVYFYVLDAGKERLTRKLVLLK